MVRCCAIQRSHRQGHRGRGMTQFDTIYGAPVPVTDGQCFGLTMLCVAALVVVFFGLLL